MTHTISGLDGEAVAFAFDNIEQHSALASKSLPGRHGIERRTLHLPE